MSRKVLPYAAGLAAVIGSYDYITGGGITGRFGGRPPEQLLAESVVREQQSDYIERLLLDSGSSQFIVPIVSYVAGNKALHDLTASEIDRILTLHLMQSNGEEHKRYSQNPVMRADYEAMCRVRKNR